MEKRHWNIIITYVVMQLSAFIGGPLLLFLGVPKAQIPGTWLVISFTIGLIIILLLLKPDIQNRHERKDRASLPYAVVWSILGVFLALIAQSIAASIEMNLFGIDPGSENTELLIEIAKATPLSILVTSILAPILEEIIFRKILFGMFYEKFNFWIAAILSSLIFAAFHWDFSHILIYSAAGFSFAFLYVKTKRILVPIVAHAAMNTFVVLVNIVWSDDIKNLEQQLEQAQSFIGGFFL